MTLRNLIKTQAPPICKTYFNTTWEFWKRHANRGTLWDWAVDGPFCHDAQCGQRMRPGVRGHHNVWVCIRCNATCRVPELDLGTLRERVIRFFEEEARSYT